MSDKDRPRIPGLDPDESNPLHDRQPGDREDHVSPPRRPVTEDTQKHTDNTPLRPRVRIKRPTRSL